MTGGFLRAPIMRPHHCWTALHVSFLAGLLLTLNADSEESGCIVELRVRHGTVYEADLGGDLRINCKVSFCNSSPPTVTWYKRDGADVPVNVSSSSHIKMEWKRLKHLEGRSMLVFQNVLSTDAGLYCCKTGESVSHNINVSVRGNDERTNVTQTNRTGGTTSDTEPSPDLWMYILYSAAGTLAFVLIVIIISVFSMRGCKGKSKREAQTENQYVVIPIVEQPFPHAGRQPSPRGSPSAPPSRRSSRGVRPHSQPIELALPRDSGNLYGKVKKDRERQGTREDEGGSVVYAALNHQLPARAAARPRRPKEETSEYAAIRVKDP